jgi:hypothetical protein
VGELSFAFPYRIGISAHFPNFRSSGRRKSIAASSAATSFFQNDSFWKREVVAVRT